MQYGLKFEIHFTMRKVKKKNAYLYFRLCKRLPFLADQGKAMGVKMVYFIIMVVTVVLIVTVVLVVTVVTLVTVVTVVTLVTSEYSDIIEKNCDKKKMENFFLNKK